MEGAVLSIDTGSPEVSVALGSGGLLRAIRSARLERSSTQLLRLIDEVLREAGVRSSDLGGILALRGPGSFTGLRIGLATALGLHQALRIPATAISTFQALASASAYPGQPILTVTDALRGEWSTQLFPQGDPDAPGGEPQLLTSAGIESLTKGHESGLTVTGFDLHAIRQERREVLGGPISWKEASALAGPAVCWFTGRSRTWDAGLLSEPIYSRPPAVSFPKPRRGTPITAG